MKNLKKYSMIGLLPVLVAAGGQAQATLDPDDFVCNQEEFEGCLNGVSSAVTNGAALRQGTTKISETARKRQLEEQNPQAARVLYGDTGLAAGDGMQGSVFGMWGSYSYNDFESDFVFAGTPLGYDAHAHNALGGIDRLFQGRYLLGLAFAYQALQADTIFNGGEQDADGYTVAPYAAVLLNDVFSLDVSGGYAWIDYDQDRISPADGSDIGAGFDGERWFFATNLNAVLPVDRFIFAAKVGYLYTEEDQDAYVEAGNAVSANAGVLRSVGKRTIDLEQLVVGGEIAYSGSIFEPFVGLDYRNDLSRSFGRSAGGLPAAFTTLQPGDDDEIQINAGLRYYTNWGVTAAFEYQRIEDRTDFDSDLFIFTLRTAL